MKEEELKLIDNYFQNQLNEAERQAFVNKLNADSDFAETVAFYTHTKAIERDKIVAERHKEWTSKPAAKQINFKRIASSLAAMLLITVGIFYFYNKENKDSQYMADQYIKTDLATLPLKMDAAEDSLELGKKLCNDKKYHEAFDIFNQIKKPEALEYQGLCALKSNDFLRATAIFENIAGNTELLNNKGKFYLGLTYLKMGEKQKGETILKEVIAGNLGGKAEAEKILK